MNVAKGKLEMHKKQVKERSKGTWTIIQRTKRGINLYGTIKAYIISELYGWIKAPLTSHFVCGVNYMAGKRELMKTHERKLELAKI